MISWKKVVKAGFKSLGYDIQKYNAKPSPVEQIVSSFRQFDIDLVFDVGANCGQFATDLRGAGYEYNIVSFEPLTEAHSIVQRASIKDNKWDVHFRCALGDRNDKVIINIAGNSMSSSLLPMLSKHATVAPDSAYVGKESVPLIRLDSVAHGYLKQFQNPFLKIDTQGFEWAVLDGAESILSKMRGALVELSLIPLYENQHLWREVIDRMERNGLALWALQPEFVDYDTGQTLQVNGIFFRLD